MVPFLFMVALAVAADIVLLNGSIYTIDKDFSKAQALAISDGRIDYVGTNEGALKSITGDTKVINLGGRMVMPGLIDAHMHILGGGETLIKCNLNYQYLGIEKVLEHIQGCIENDVNKGDNDWLEVINLDYPSLVDESGPPSKHQLDRLNTKRPIYIKSSDYHTSLANSRALELSGIRADTPDPPNGVIERLPGTQDPSGVLQDSAAHMLIGSPEPTIDESKTAAIASLKLLREAGITTFQDASATAAHYDVLSAIEKEGNLTSRAFLDYRIESPASIGAIPDTVKNAKERLSSLPGSKSPLGPRPAVKSQSIKGFLDGVITYPSITGALIEPYWTPLNGSNSNSSWAPNPKTLHETYWKPEILAKTLEQLFLADIDVQLHCDGDLAVRVAIDAAEAFRNAHPEHDFRLGVAHAELSHQDDWPRFAELGVNPIISYQWAQLSSFFINDTFNSISQYRHRNLEAFGELEAHGSTIVYGSDWPVDPLDEFLALKVAVTRYGDPENPNSEAFRGPPFDKPFLGPGVSRKSAIQSITINGAGFLRSDNEIGSLEKGKLADLIVLDKDFFEIPDEELGRPKVLLTMLGGEVLYVADGYDFGVRARYPNEDETPSGLSRRTVGGFAGRELSTRGKATVAKLRKRRGCRHGHSH